MLGKRATSGLNLLETIIAVTIFGGLVVALLNIWIAHAKALDHTQNMLVAANLAESVMESQIGLGFKVKSMPKKDIELNRIVDDIVVPITFTYEIGVVDTSGPTGPEVKQVRVRVTWKEQDVEKEVVVESLIYWQS